MHWQLGKRKYGTTDRAESDSGTRSGKCALVHGSPGDFLRLMRR